MAKNRIITNRDRWAYDLSNKPITKGEIWDTDVINQSIENILSTTFGERLFNPNFGSPLTAYLFEGITQENGERLLDSVIESIKRWEDRVYILENQARLFVSQDTNEIRLYLPYRIKRNNIVSNFDKKIIL